MNMLKNIKTEIKQNINKERVYIYSSFFKTGPGEYAEEDKFFGVTVPVLRKVAKKYYKEISYSEIISLLQANMHEYKLISLFLLIYKYDNTEDENIKKEIFDLYIENIEFVNNWDFVDYSAPNILGNFLYNYKKDRKLLYDFANTNYLWIQRIAILSTFYFIKNNDFNDTLNISEILLTHKHDLIHKAVGWMLREVGKRDFDKEVNFLKKFYKKMPRTMLRYAIEKFGPDLRNKFLKNLV